MKDENTVALEWVCSEGTSQAFVTRVGNDGGEITGTMPFVPKPEESDLYSDAQFDPLVIVGTFLASGMVLRYVRELVRIEYAWRSLYDDVWWEAALLHMDRHNREFFTGQATIHESTLFDEHVGYKMAHTMLALACDHLEVNRPSDFLVGPQKMPSGMRALWTMDFLLGCSCMTRSRTPDLLAFIAPPVIRFADGRIWNLGALFDQLPHEAAVPSTANHPMLRASVANALLTVDEKWNDMQLKVLET